MFWNISFTVIHELVRIVSYILSGHPFGTLRVPSLYFWMWARFLFLLKYLIKKWFGSVLSFLEEVWSSLSSQIYT